MANEWTPVEQTATGPDGQKVALVGGNWVPATQTATGPGGKRVALLAEAGPPAASPSTIERLRGMAQQRVKEQQQANVGAQQLFGRDASKAGQLTGSDYLRKMAGGAATGGVIGAGIGAVTGPGALATGAVGAGTGAISGLLEAGAEDLGFGPGTQMAAGMLAPSPGALVKPAQKLLGEAATNLVTKGVTSAKDMVAEIAAHKMFGFGAYPMRRVSQAIERARPVDVAALEAETGIPAAANIKPGSVENVTRARQDLAAQYGVPADKAESAVYEGAKNQYDQLIRQNMDFTRSKEFVNLVASYPKNSQKFVADTYGGVFKQAGSLKPGDVVVNDLKKLDNLTPKQQAEIRTTFNDYLERTTGKRWEEEARGAAEKVFVARAKDQLPTLLTNSAKEVAGSAESRRILKSQIQNFSKTPETRQVFWEETSNALKDLSVADAKALWTSIGPEVKKHLITDPQKYQKITEIMSGAKTPKEVSNAVRLMIKAGVTQFTVDTE